MPSLTLWRVHWAMKKIIWTIGFTVVATLPVMAAGKYAYRLLPSMS
jgi:hypothetical protein